MRPHALPDGRIPVLLSAHDEELIGRDAAAILDHLQHHGEPGDRTAAVAATLLRTRRVRRYRALVRAADQAELVAGLRALAGGDDHPLVATSSESRRPRTAFVFPGQGTRWHSMGSAAYRHLPAYRAEADRCARAFAAAALPSPLRYLLSDEDHGWSQIDIQGAQFTHAVSLAQVWRCCGIVPDMTLGHSLGEVAAAYVAGSVALPDAVAVVAARARVLDRLPGRYGMAVLGVGAAEAERMIAEAPGWLEVSVINAPSSTVVSGDREAVAHLVRRADEDGVFVRELDVDFPAHTTALRPLRRQLCELLPAAQFSDSPVPFIGSAGGGVVPAGTQFADYWWANLRNTVRFDQAVAAARRRDAAMFVELSAHPALLYALSDLADDALVVGSGRRDEPLLEQLAAGIAAAALADPTYRWADSAGLDGHRLLPEFPYAPMRAVHLWAHREPLPPPPGAALTVAAEQWEPSPATLRTESQCRVAVLGPGDDPLPGGLTAAVAAHHGADLVEPSDAEVVVLVAPQQPDGSAAADEIIEAAKQLDYRRAVGAGCQRLWLVTVNAESVQPGEPVRPVQAALTAMHRSVGFEFPDTTFAHLDVPRRDVDANLARCCVDVLRGAATDVAVRAGAAGPASYARTLRESASPTPDAPADTLVENVLVTGGSGVVGLRYARYCIEHGARRVVVLSRKGMEPADVAKLAGRHAVDVHAPACDITDREAVRAAAAEYGGSGASLLVHAAGVARFGSHEQLTDVDWADVFDAKVAGLANLIDLWPRRGGSRILLCSSVSGVWGGHGHAAYSAANRVLDVVAAGLRAEAIDCTSVRWGLWPGTAIGDPAAVKGFERAGLVAMDADAAVRASLRTHAGDPLIFAADFDRLQKLFESQGMTASFVTSTASSHAGPGGDAAGQRSAAEVVRAELAAALSLAGPESVDLGVALIDLGVDSLLALDLRKRLRRSSGHSVPLAELLGGITGVELIEALEQSMESARD